MGLRHKITLTPCYQTLWTPCLTASRYKKTETAAAEAIVIAYYARPPVLSGTDRILEMLVDAIQAKEPDTILIILGDFNRTSNKMAKLAKRLNLQFAHRPEE